MDISSKLNKIENTKKYIKTNDVFFIFNGINRNSTDLLITEQNIKSTPFKCKKMTNKTVSLAIEKSIYANVNNTITGVLFFTHLKSNSQFLIKKVVLNKFESLFFILSAIKFNNKIYSATQLKKINVLDYRDNNQLLFQFLLVNLKKISKTLKKSK